MADSFEVFSPRVKWPRPAATEFKLGDRLNAAPLLARHGAHNGVELGELRWGNDFARRTVPAIRARPNALGQERLMRRSHAGDMQIILLLFLVAHPAHLRRGNWRDGAAGDMGEIVQRHERPRV